MRDSYPQSLENILKELEGSNKSTLQFIQQRATILLQIKSYRHGTFTSTVTR